jgi:hypothetical protein
MQVRFPWETEPAPVEAPPPLEHAPPPKRRGRRPASGIQATSSGWLYHHLTISGPSAPVAAFADAARGAGVIPWQLDFDRIEEDLFNLAAAQPARTRSLTMEGCRILARQFRDRVEAWHGKAAALAGHSRACPFDLQTLLPVPPAILLLGPTHPSALAWLSAQWGTTDGLRQVAERQKPVPGGRLPAGHAVIGYSFFTASETPHAAMAQLGARWPVLRFGLQPRPAD